VHTNIRRWFAKPSIGSVRLTLIKVADARLDVMLDTSRRV